MPTELERITTTEAAHRLGVSGTQVRRLIRSGKLRAVAERRPQGTRLLVLWDATQDATKGASTTTQPGDQQATDTPPDAPQVATQDATHAQLVEEVRWLKERLERAEDERAELRRMLFLEQQTVAGLRALHAPQVATYDATVDATHRTSPATATEASNKRPWWRFWGGDDGQQQVQP